MAMLYVMVANICSLKVHGPGLREWRTPKTVTPQSGSAHSRNLAHGKSKIWITDPLSATGKSQSGRIGEERQLECIQMDGNRLLKKVAMKVPITAHDMPRK